MRAAIVIILLILSSAAIAQRARTGSEPGTGRIERPSRGGAGITLETPSYEPPSLDRPLESVIPDGTTRSLSTPSAGGGGPPGGHGHTPHGHSHSHCHEEWYCGMDHYVAIDNYPVGTSVSRLRVGGYWVPGPCRKESVC
jgi:hypothetical protein